MNYWGTPKEVFPALAKLVDGKIFCDVGCGHGHVLKAMEPHAKQLFGIELQDGPTNIARDRNLKVFQGDARVAPIPFADVYYLWLPQFLVTQVLEHVIRDRSRITVVLGFELSWPPELKYWHNHHTQYKENIFIEFNDEDRRPKGREHGLFCLSIIKI